MIVARSATSICIHINVTEWRATTGTKSSTVVLDSREVKLWSQTKPDRRKLTSASDKHWPLHEEFKAYGRYEKCSPETFLETGLGKIPIKSPSENETSCTWNLCDVVSSNIWKTCNMCVHLMSYSLSKHISVQTMWCTERKSVLVSVSCYYSTNWSQFSSLPPYSHRL